MPDIDPYDYAAEVMSGVADAELVSFYIRLREACGQSCDVFFRPDINGDTVDLIIMSRSKGIILINECKDLAELEVAVGRLENIKENLFSVHLRTIKADSVVNKSVFNCVKCALYFPDHTDAEVNAALAKLKYGKGPDQTQKYGKGHDKDRFAYLCRFTRTTRLEESLERISPKTFKSDYYEELVGIISSRWHSYKDGDLNFRLSPRQKEIVRSGSKRLRVKGVAGCGKTQVVANRAVEQHLKTGEKVLILTFNITLIQYIRLRISQVPADFSPNMFEVINYHQFFNSKANQYSSLPNKALAAYDDADYFTPYRDCIKKYKSIIIDEVQDFKETWLQSIISNFLTEDGSVSLFGDGKQNIYGRVQEADTRMPPARGCGFAGRWSEMSERISMRIQNPKLASLSSAFASSLMGDKSPLAVQDSLLSGEYFIKYAKIKDDTPADTLAGYIKGILSKFSIKAADVAVLGQYIYTLRSVEEAYARLTGQKTMICFENSQQFDEVMKKSSPAFIKKDLKDIRCTAKTHFTTACDCIKLSTIHSFKGWEAKTVILLLQPEYYPLRAHELPDGEITNPSALINTALTRAKCNLFILNLGNDKYHKFFAEHIK